MMDELAALGCDTPVIPGIFPFINVAGLPAHGRHERQRSSRPGWSRSSKQRVDGDKEATRALGVEVASELGARLLAEGVPGLHLYTMNKARSVREVCANLGVLQDDAGGPPG